jgi:hypothetical protein
MDTEFLHAVKASVRRFAEERLAPMAGAFEHGRESPFPLMREMAEQLGFEGVAASSIEALDRRPPGGSGRPRRDDHTPLFATILQELARVNPGFALSFGASTGLCGQTLLLQGTPVQRARWALPVLSLQRIGAWALTEPEAGSDAFSLQTLARAVGDGWELSGRKTFISNAPVADVFVVYARLDEGAGSAPKKLAAFVLERGMPGLATSAPFEKMGMRSSPTGAIYLDQVRVGREHLLGGAAEAGGRRAIVESLLGERIALCALALGIIESSLERSIRYAKERSQFGQPIASFQAVQLRLARMYAAQEVVRALLEKGFGALAAGSADLAWLCAAKYTASTLATEVALEAVQVLGGNGYMQEYLVEGLARDAKLLEIGGGTSDIQLLSIAREILS